MESSHGEPRSARTTIFLRNQSRIGWRGGRMDWARILASITGMVDQKFGRSVRHHRSPGGESGEIEASNGEIVWRQDSTVRKRHAHQHDSSSSTRDYISSY